MPLVSHAQFQPAGVAGLSPSEQFTINELVQRTPFLPASFASLMQLPEAVGAASRGAVDAGRGSKGAAGALDFLSQFLGRDVRPEPATAAPFPAITRQPTPETAFPGLTRATLEGARSSIATGATPLLGGAGGVVIPTQPGTIQAPPVIPRLPTQEELNELVAFSVASTGAASAVPPGFVRVPPDFPGGHGGEVIPLQVWEVWSTMPGVPLEQVMASMSGSTRAQGEG